MNKPLLLVVLALGLTGGVHAAEGFSRAIAPEDFSSAGLGKLSPAELARLDALVQRYQTGAITAAREEAATAAAAEIKAAKAEAAQAKEKTNLLSRAKVLLRPGTEIEYETVESRIVGDIRGWSPKAIFTLEDGTKWREADGTSYSGPLLKNPAVRVRPGVLGSFWMRIEGIKPEVKVALVGK